MITALAGHLSRHRKYRQTTRELRSLTDRELHDLGIGRDDIARIARESVAGI